ncbi:JM98 [macacine gammaherpesvirus 11]|uniref:JM98 n=2 Tax=macacine gammaherpesvirus 11 TaxID=2560570 RepID=G9JMS6_9GAMA|nr:JM98 [Macaca fuscata rhadinovirus]AAT00075.1 JM98 [Macaca fuscata rhadinovirus]AEW87623.1 JM98 [Macaca fuscata rhadinovirus]AEW87793.1 JM98 [Macaca fuscata rhadinovirus]
MATWCPPHSGGPSAMGLREWIVTHANLGTYSGLFWADDEKTRVVLATTTAWTVEFDYPRDGKVYEDYCNQRNIPLPSGRPRLCQAKARLLGAIRKSAYFVEEKNFLRRSFSFPTVVFRLRSNEEMSCRLCPRASGVAAELRGLRFRMFKRKGADDVGRVTEYTVKQLLGLLRTRHAGASTMTAPATEASATTAGEDGRQDESEGGAVALPEEHTPPLSVSSGLSACLAPSVDDPWGFMHIQVYYYGFLQSQVFTRTGMGVRLSTRPTDKNEHHVCMAHGPLQLWLPPAPHMDDDVMLSRLVNALNALEDGIVLSSCQYGIMMNGYGFLNLWFRGNTLNTLEPTRVPSGVGHRIFDTDDYITKLAQSPRPSDPGPPDPFAQIWVAAWSLYEEEDLSQAPICIIVHQREIYRHFE